MYIIPLNVNIFSQVCTAMPALMKKDWCGVKLYNLLDWLVSGENKLKKDIFLKTLTITVKKRIEFIHTASDSDGERFGLLQSMNQSINIICIFNLKQQCQRENKHNQ